MTINAIKRFTRATARICSIFRYLECKFQFYDGQFIRYVVQYGV